MYTLYTYWRSSCSYRVRLALNYKEIPFDSEPVHLVKDGGEQLKEDFLLTNPKGEVPALVLPTDRIITQSLAIIQYLEATHPLSPRLFPEDPYLKAQVVSFCEIINSGIQPLQNLKVLKKVQADFNADKKLWSQFWIKEGFKALEKSIPEDTPRFCFGHYFTAADCFLLPQVYNALRFEVYMGDFPKIMEIYSRLVDLDFVKKSVPETQIDAPENV